MSLWRSGVVAAVCAGFASCAWAQNSVTLYGMVDVLMDISNQGHGTVVKEASGGSYGSRWGLVGKEDLGGGYQAIFKLENGFYANNGVIGQGGALFGRQAWVGVQGPFGALTMGRQYAPEFLAVSAFDAFNAQLGGSFWNIDKTLFNGTVESTLMTDVYTSRTNNSVVYASPSLYGLKVSGMYAFGGVPGSLDDGSTASVGVSYLNGPIALYGGYTRLKDATDPGSYVEWGAGGTYVLGSAIYYAGYTKDIYSDTNTKTSEGSTVRFGMFNLGLTYNFAFPLQFIVQVTKVINSSDGLAASQNAFAEGVELSYQLSKRTNVYAGYSHVNNRNGSTYSLGGSVYYGNPAVPDATAQAVQIGMRTTF